MKKLKKMKKGKIIMVITIGLACFVLATVMCMQFKVVRETDITSIESMRKSELTSELASWKEKYEETNQKYEETITKLEEYKKSEKSTEESTKLLQNELEQINMTLGKTDVQGEGIILTMKNSTSDSVTPINADDLLVIVNSLKLAGAEAISINDQRVINTTDIVYINNSFIKVNQQRILSPYIIKVIGNQSYLESGITGAGGHVDDLKKVGHDITIEKNNKINIKKYDSDIEVKYME